MFAGPWRHVCCHGHQAPGRSQRALAHDPTTVVELQGQVSGGEPWLGGMPVSTHTGILCPVTRALLCQGRPTTACAHGQAANACFCVRHPALTVLSVVVAVLDFQEIGDKGDGGHGKGKGMEDPHPPTLAHDV